MRKTIKQKGLAHYDKMIAWAEKQPKRVWASFVDMKLAIGESWNAESCPYCVKYNYQDCEGCKLAVGSLNGDATNCCNGLWTKMDDATTWGTWVKRAHRVRQYIEKHG